MTNPQDEKTAEKFTGGNALELVAHQAGAVVSREIVKKKTGTVTVFAFDKAQGLSEHITRPLLRPPGTAKRRHGQS